MAFTDRSRAMRVSGDTVLPEFLGQPFYALPEMARVNRLLKWADRGVVFTGLVAHEASVQMVAMNAISPIERLSVFLLVLDQLAGSHGTRALAYQGLCVIRIVSEWLACMPFCINTMISPSVWLMLRKSQR